MIYRVLADLTVFVHAAYVLFVVAGFLMTLVGMLCRWQWTRGFWFRSLHLAMILVVVAESLLGITCPLTTLEHDLRLRAGQTSYTGSFMGEVVHNLLFFDAPEWVFTILYCFFGSLVVVVFIWWPPAWPFAGRPGDAEGKPNSRSSEETIPP